MINKQELCEYLMNLDREFDKTTAELGLEGWVSYFAEDGVMVPAQVDVIKGKEDVRQAMGKSFSLPGFSLRWEPLDAQVSEDGSMGYTYGKYVRTNLDQEGNIQTGTGKYTTIWQKQQDGSWKIVLDMGN